MTQILTVHGINPDYTFSVFKINSGTEDERYNVVVNGLTIFSIHHYEEEYVLTEFGMGEVFFSCDLGDNDFTDQELPDAPTTKSLHAMLEILNQKLIEFNHAFQSKMINTQTLY